MDYIIKDGWIVNGKKEKPFHGDLVIENGKIAEVGTHVEIPADFSKRACSECGRWLYNPPASLTFTDTETGRPLETGMMSF